MKTQLDFGDRATGRVVDPITFHASKPARYAAGTVTTLYPQASNIVGITYSNGETVTVRVST